MRVFFCQTSSTLSKVPVIPYSQLALASEIEDIAEVQVAGYSDDGTYPESNIILDKIYEFKPDIVGITIEYAVAYDVSVELAKKIKEFNSEIMVLAGGHHATFTASQLLHTGHIDAILTGEGEISIREFVLTKDCSKTPNAIYLSNGEMVKTPPAPLVDVNELKPPAYHLLTNGLKPLMGIESSRGCPFNCDFCETRNFFGSGKIRKMSPQHFISNFKKVVEDTGGGNFIMLDDCFTADMVGHVKPICEAMIKEDLPVSIFFQGRVDDMLRHLELLPLLAEAKFNSVLLGIEAIYDETLDLMNKKAKYNKDTIEKLITACKENGIAVFAAIVFGYPNETPEMIQNTAEYLISLDVDTVSMTIATPIPGSALYKKAVENQQLLTTDYNLYGGMHRVLSTIPETTPAAAANARRRFFIRPDYIRRTLNNAINPDKSDIRSFMPAGLLCHNLSQKDQSMPRNIEEWIKTIEGLKLFLNDHLVKNWINFSANVGFEIETDRIVIKVEDGIPVDVKASKENCDILLQCSVETLTDLLIWSPTDIISAFILGKVKIDSDVYSHTEFIIWFSKIQDLLRWAITMKMSVPELRYWFMEWLDKNQHRREKFYQVMHNERSLYLGTEGMGMVLEFSETRGFSNISMHKNYMGNTDYKIIVSEDEFKGILNNGIDLFSNILDVIEFEDYSKLVKEMKKPGDFFKTLPDKFRKEKAKDVNLVIQYIIDMGNDSTERWNMEIKEGCLHIAEGTGSATPTAIIDIPLKNFQKMINGKITPFELYASGGMRLNGLPPVMIKMSSCFINLFNNR